jgi:hypothetical protein
MDAAPDPKPYLAVTDQADLQSSGLTSEQIAATGHFSVDKVMLITW